jgi:hypothetical protein
MAIDSTLPDYLPEMVPWGNQRLPSRSMAVGVATGLK